MPLSEGKFGFDDYVRHVMEFIEILGPDTHVVATCQAAPPAMVAAAMLARDKPEFKPATLTLMGGPVDTRVNPGALGKTNEACRIAWPSGEPMQIRHAVTGMRRVPGNAARLQLAFIDHHPSGPSPAQFDRSTEPGRPGADDHSICRVRCRWHCDDRPVGHGRPIHVLIGRPEAAAALAHTAAEQ